MFESNMPLLEKRTLIGISKYHTSILFSLFLPHKDMTEIVKVGWHFEIRSWQIPHVRNGHKFIFKCHWLKWWVVSCLVVCTLLNKLYDLFQTFCLFLFGVVLLWRRLCWVVYLPFLLVSGLEPNEMHIEVVFLKCIPEHMFGWTSIN